MKPKIILTHKYLDEAIAILADRFNLVQLGNEPIDVAAALTAHPDCRALISFLSDPVSEAAMAAAPGLTIIANYAVGYNNIDVAAARRRRIWVTHTPDVLTDASADLTMALILAVARRLVEADAFTRLGHFSGWGAELFLGKELNGAVLGIVGLGRIGKAVARRARAFGMEVIHCSRHRHAGEEKELGVRSVPFLELVRRSDVISLHVPFSPDLHHLFNRDTFALMKRDAIFVNAARGPLMDEAALAEKLERNELFGAGLDVYELEPVICERLKRLPRVVLLPHIASATRHTRLAMAMMTVEAVTRALAGEKPPHLVPEYNA
jgi:glyoxylate reductase